MIWLIKRIINEFFRYIFFLDKYVVVNYIFSYKPYQELNGQTIIEATPNYLTYVFLCYKYRNNGDIIIQKAIKTKRKTYDQEI